MIIKLSDNCPECEHPLDRHYWDYDEEFTTCPECEEKCGFRVRDFPITPKEAAAE